MEIYFVTMYCPNNCIEPIPVRYDQVNEGSWKCTVCGSLCHINFKNKTKAIDTWYPKKERKDVSMDKKC